MATAGFARAAFACCLIISSLAGANAQTVSLSIGPTQRLALEVPNGLCHVDPSGHEVDAKLFSFMARLQQGHNKLLAVFVDCPAIKAYRSGGTKSMERWSMVLLPLQKGEVRPVQGITRTRLVEQIAQQFSSEKVDELLSKNSDYINQRLSNALKEIGTASSLTTQRTLGMLSKDDVAAFTGLLMQEKTDGKTRLISGVFGMTLVREYIVSANSYRVFVDRGTYDVLLAETRDLLRGLILRNENEATRINSIAPSAPEKPKSPMVYQAASFDWDRIIGKAISGAIVGAMLGGIAYLVGRFRKKPND